MRLGGGNGLPRLWRTGEKDTLSLPHEDRGSAHALLAIPVTKPPLPQFGLGVLAALPAELEPLSARAHPIAPLWGVPLWRGPEPGLCLALAGVGKVAAAQACAALLAQGVAGVLVVGTAGAVSSDLRVGDRVHVRAAVQADLAVRTGRATETDPAWRAHWQALTPGAEGLILSGDRPVMSAWARRKLRRAFSGTLFADMEVAAAGAVCQRAGIPYAALKVITDRAGRGSQAEFEAHFSRLAGEPARSLLAGCPDSGSTEERIPFGFPSGSGLISG